MVRFQLSPRAQADIESILAWTHEHFGEQARLRYEALLAQAILDVAGDPDRDGLVERSELWPGAFTYHLRWSRANVSSKIGRVRKPRHFLVGRITAEGRLEIARVLHDSMDLDTNLPPDYR